MEPIRKRFFVNGRPVPATEAHTQYLKPAFKLLEEVRQQMSEGVEQYQRSVVTEDGARLTALRRHEQTEIHIDIPTSRGSQRKRGAFCIWEPNKEQYVRILDWVMSSAVMDREGAVIYARGNESIAPSPHHGNGTVYRIDAENMTITGSFTLNSGVHFLNSSEVKVDTLNNVFTCDFAPSDEEPHAIAHWAPGDASYTQFNVPGSLRYSINGGNYATSGGHTWTLSQYDPDFPSHPWDLEVFTTAGLAKVATQTLNQSDNDVSVYSSETAGVVASWAEATGEVAALNPKIVFAQLVQGRGEVSIPSPLQTTGYEIAQSFVMDNSGGQAWVCVAVRATADVLVTDYTVSLYHSRGGAGWEEVSVEGLGFVAGLPQGLSMQGELLAHDPVTDAVALLLPDASGVHVFNAKDCLGNPIPPFFEPINVPSPVYRARACQLQEGVLIIVSDEAVFEYPRYTTVGKITLGRLRQTKIEQL